MTMHLSLCNRRYIVLPLLVAYVCLLGLTAAPHAHVLSAPLASSTPIHSQLKALSAILGEHHADSCPLCIWSATAGFALAQSAFVLHTPADMTALAVFAAPCPVAWGHSIFQTRAPPSISL